MGFSLSQKVAAAILNLKSIWWRVCVQYVRCAFDFPEAQWREEDGAKDELSKQVVQVLLSKVENHHHHPGLKSYPLFLTCQCHPI